MANTVSVKNISHTTSEKEVSDFFSFCGKITSLKIKPESSAADSPLSAEVTFEKETAAKTALLLDNTQLGPSHVQVSSAASSTSTDATKSTSANPSGSSTGEDIEQEDKPRSRIVAEYLAHGYVLGDQALERALSLDKQHGISARFTSALAQFDNRLKATDKARAIDSSYGVTDKGMSAWKGANSYFEKVIGTPTGQKLAAFYTTSEKQVLDIHNEARRLADLKKASETGAGAGSAAPGVSIPATEKEKSGAEHTSSTPATTSTEKTG